MICKKNKDAWYYFFNFLTISSAGSLLATVKNVYCRKNTAIIRWSPLRVTALQVMRTSFLGPIPRLLPPTPPPPPSPHLLPARYTWMYLVWIVSLFRKSRGLKISFKCKLCVILGVPEDWPFQLSVWLACYCCHGWHYVHKKPPFLWSVFNHVASIYANLLEQKKAFA